MCRKYLFQFIKKGYKKFIKKVYKKRNCKLFIKLMSFRTAIIKSNYSNLIENLFFRIKSENLNEWII